MKNIIVVLLLVFVYGCNVQRWRNKKYPPSSSIDTVTYINYDTVITYIDTIVEFHIPADTVVDSVLIYIPCEDEVDFSQYRVFAENDLSYARSWFDMNPLQLKLELVQKDTTLITQLDRMIKEVQYWKDQYVNITETKVTEVKFIPKVYKFSLWWFIISLFCIILFIVIKAVK